MAKFKKTMAKILTQIKSGEGTALFIILSMTLGALAFYHIFGQMWSIGHINWWIVATVSALLALPQAFVRLKGYDGPYIVWFAKAFGAGFFALPKQAPTLSKAAISLRTLWNSLRQQAPEDKPTNED